MINFTNVMSSLQELLPKLQAGEFECLEYGDPAHVGGYASHLRIYYIPTMGGPQFGVKEISSHVEGSGAYFPTVESCLEYVMKRLAYYHRPLPKHMEDFRAQLQSKLGRKDQELSFFPLQASDLVESRAKASGLVRYRMGGSRAPANTVNFAGE